MMEMKADMLAEAPTPAPQETRRATYARMGHGPARPPGKRGPSRSNARPGRLRSRILIRPSLDPKAFCKPDAAFAQPKELPQGTGIFLVDGAMLDQREFSFAGRGGRFFSEPILLTCDVTLLNKKTGEKGLFGQKQSFAWDWNLKIRNTASYPAAIRVEEPRPLIRDERIILTLTATPKLRGRSQSGTSGLERYRACGRCGQSVPSPGFPWKPRTICTSTQAGAGRADQRNSDMASSGKPQSEARRTYSPAGI